ncbi:MAG: RecX family transcriptional regulator [Bdellovibrionales bacterium]|nr:RecX family transcriptional regulator [Bdellovibrionales bacterium]
MEKNSRIPESRKWWLDLALFYCSKRETSRSKLKGYFLRKMREYRIPSEHLPEQVSWCESVLDELQEKKIIDHERFAGILHRDYERRGKGKRYIEQKFKERGIAEELPGMKFSPEEELERARTLAVRTMNRSSIQKLTDPYQIRTKLLQKLVSSGFEFDLAKKAVELVLRSK